MTISVRILTIIFTLTLGFYNLFVTTNFLLYSIKQPILFVPEQQAIIWINFLTGNAYIIASIGIIKKKKWPYLILFLNSFLLLLGLVDYIIYMQSNFKIEIDNVFALLIRIAGTIICTFGAFSITLREETETSIKSIE